MFVPGPPVPMLPALPAYDSPDCRGGGEMYRSPLIGYGSLNRALSGRRVSAKGGSFVPGPGAGIGVDVGTVVEEIGGGGGAVDEGPCGTSYRRTGDG